MFASNSIEIFHTRQISRLAGNNEIHLMSFFAENEKVKLSRSS